MTYETEQFLKSQWIFQERKRGKHLSSRQKTETYSRFSEDATSVYGILYPAVSFLLDLCIPYFYSQIWLLHILIALINFGNAVIH